MNNYSKERILGSIILLGGGLLLIAMLFRTGASSEQPVLDTTSNQDTASPSDNLGLKTGYDNLTADFETEQRILEKKRKLREARMSEQQKLVDAYIALQEEANDDALEKAKRELEFARAAVEHEQPAVTLEPIQTQADKKAQLDKRKKQQAEQDDKIKALEAKQKQQQQKQRQAQLNQQRLQAEADKADKEKQDAALSYNDAKRKLKMTRAQVAKGEIEANGTFGVQVALAGSQAQAEVLAAKLKKHGYKPAFSRTSRGIRVLVGPEKGKAVALALKDKINADKRLGVQGAWVTFVDPAHLKAEKQALKVASRPDTSKDTKEAQRQTAQDKQQADIKEDNATYGVQVALASDTKNAERLITKLKKAGYDNISTSKTSRGVRVVVGANLAKDKALTLRDKLNADSRLGTSGAWIKRE